MTAASPQQVPGFSPSAETAAWSRINNELRASVFLLHQIPTRRAAVVNMLGISRDLQ